MRNIYIFILSISLFNPLFSQEKWDVTTPKGSWGFKQVALETDEGTWMSLDVSPDGSQIVFDMLGDIFIMPVAGGEARPIRTGLPYEVQPRFSPDGKKISFTSDAGGGDNIWMMNNDGSDAVQVTNEDFRLLNNAVWTPDGQYLVARKHFSSGRSLGAGEMWMYHISGGSGLQLTKRKNDQQDVNEPSISPDGRYLYYCEDMYPGGFFQYNKDPNSQIYVIYRYDMQTGEKKAITGGPGSASRPVVSRDGKLLAFVRRVRTKSVLFLHDLGTGEEWPVFDQLNKDQQEAWAIFGTYPNFSWTPDNKNIILWADGKIKKVDVTNHSVLEIPFEVKTELTIAEALRFKNETAPDEFTARAIRHAVTSPDGKWLVFNAAGYLWKKQLPEGTPVRLTTGTNLEFEPSFSRDGKKIVFVTWNDVEKGAIMTFDWLNKKAKPVKISGEKGIYRTPAFNSDGSRVVFQKESGNGHMGHSFTKQPGLYLIPSQGGKQKFLIEEGSYPSFNLSGDRIYYQTGGYFFGNITKELRSVNLDGKEKRTHITSKYGNRIIPSPNEKWVAFINLHKAYIAPLPQTGQAIDISSSTKSFPVAQVSRDAGINIHWSADSERINWTLGDEYFSNEISQRFTFLPHSPDSLPAIDTTGLKIGLTLKHDKPSGRIAFKGATILTMDGEKIIENGVIIVNENRIESIGNIDLAIPRDAKVYDVSGKTILPGFIDAHAHLGQFRYGLSPQNHWQYYANLAFGVTTAHDPSANTEMIFSQSEMVKAGYMVGPRVFSTGIILYGADGDFKAVINNLDDARSAIRRTKAFGAFSVKSYNQPRRDQRQQVIQAAREEKIIVVPEGGSTFFHNMTMIFDGHSGVEHNIPIAPAYKDVITLWSNSNTGYTPTLIVNYAGLSGEYYWYQTTNVWEDQKLLKYTPRGVIDARSRHRTMVPMEEYNNGHILTSKTCKALADAGVKVNLGAHGQLQGLGVHWELWMLQQGGMSNMQALQAATINGAHYIGMDSDIGSLKEGKLADLIVLDKNPLEDIRNSNTVRYTMVNGRLYDTETMNETGNTEKARTKFWWELNKYNATFDWHQHTEQMMQPQCVCGKH